MTVPSELTTLNISGKYTMNKTLTDMQGMDEVLRLQGVGWFTRKAISSATLYLTINHYKDNNGVERIDVDQTANGIHPTREERTLTWTVRELYNDLYGHLIGKSRRVKADDLDKPFLKDGWTSDTYEHGVIQSYVESDTPKSGTTWVANQTWGIQEVNGERRYMRHLDFTGPKNERISAVFGYDYQWTVSVEKGRWIFSGFRTEALYSD